MGEGRGGGVFKKERRVALFFFHLGCAYDIDPLFSKKKKNTLPPFSSVFRQKQCCDKKERYKLARQVCVSHT